MKSDLSQIHWVAPALMVGTLLLGTLFAIGHHLFYNSLAGTRPPTTTFTFAGADVSDQELNIGAGTAFALLVRACLAFTITLSYIQVVWHSVKRSARQLTIADMDKILSALNNLLVMFNMFAWWKWPLLLLIATVSWLMPIATVITPATLTLDQASPPPQWRDVPAVAYTSTNLANARASRSGTLILPIDPSQAASQAYSEENGSFFTNQYEYDGASQAVKLTAIAVAAQGTVLPVSAPAQNSTWNVTFAGPSLSCENVTGTLRLVIGNDISHYINQSMAAAMTSLSRPAAIPLYLAWTPAISVLPPATQGLVQAVPYGYYSDNKTMILNTADFSARKTGNLAPLYVALIPAASTFSAANTINGISVASTSNDGLSIEDIRDKWVDPGLTLLQCNIRNVTWNARFAFTNGIQTVHTSTSDVDSPYFPVVQSADAWLPPLNSTNLPDELPKGCQGLWNDTATTTCSLDPRVLSAFSYQAVFDSFTSLLRGDMTYDIRDYTYNNPNTRVEETVLAKSPELADIISTVRSFSPLKQDLRSSYTKVPGLSQLPNEPPAMPLADALEKLFENITLSLMSSPQLQPNKSSPFYPPQANVTFTTLYTVYQYSYTKLWLAYGVAIAVSAIIVAGALVAMYLSRASYSNDFSSLLRLARGAHLSRKIVATDYDGNDPLPKYLEQAKVSFAGDRWSGKSSSSNGTSSAPAPAPAPAPQMAAAGQQPRASAGTPAVPRPQGPPPGEGSV